MDVVAGRPRGRHYDPGSFHAARLLAVKTRPQHDYKAASLNTTPKSKLNLHLLVHGDILARPRISWTTIANPKFFAHPKRILNQCFRSELRNSSRCFGKGLEVAASIHRQGQA